MNDDSKLIADRDKRYDQILAQNPNAKLPLACRLYRDPDGQPLKTQLAHKFPSSSRRERRQLELAIRKMQKKAAKKQRCGG